MRLRTQRLELAFQFVFLIDSSGQAAADQVAELLGTQVEDRRQSVRRKIDEWCSAPSKSPEGTHGDSAAAIASLRERFLEALYALVSSMLQFDAEKAPSTSGTAPKPETTVLDDWRGEVHSAFSRAARDLLTVGAAREAMTPIFDAVDRVFEDAATAVDEAVVMAREAMQHAGQTDRVTLQLAPTWPAHRQAATDRAILRLGRSEMIAGRTPAKWVVHHCVNLAKRYSTEKSPAFVNALLDKILKQVSAEGGSETAASTGSDEQEPS